jgi:RNA polymerase sigma-70 factor (ECF subfamily)
VDAKCSKSKTSPGNETPADPVMSHVTSIFLSDVPRLIQDMPAQVPGHRIQPGNVGLAATSLESGDSTMIGGNRGKQSRARFQALCLALRPDLLRFAFWLCHDYALAEDVVQESMLRAWKAQDSLEDEKAAKPWLLTIVRRELARTFERKRLNTVNVADMVALEDPALAAGDQAELAQMRAAIFKLPQEYREPLVLQALMGYSTTEIADELNLSLPAVLSRLFRARHQLRTLCGENTTEDPQE